MTNRAVREDGAAGPGARLAEGLPLAAACAAPWMLGAVDAWAVLVLEAAVGLAAVVAAFAGRTGPTAWGVFGLPGVALGALVVLALAQSAPLSERALARLDPAAAAERSALLPARPERVLGDAGPPGGRGAATLSRDPGATRAVAARLAAAWLLFQAVLAAGGGYPALRRAAWALAVNAAALALFSLVQALTWNGKIYWTFPSPAAGPWSGGGPFATHTHLAEALNLGLGLALGLALGRDASGRPLGRSNRVWAVYLAGTLLLGVVTSFSRGGFLAMLVGLAVALAGFGSRRAVAGFVLAAAVGLPALVVVVTGDAAPLAERLGTILDPGDEGYVERVAVWGRALASWRARPVWGTGFGTFGGAVDRLMPRDTGVYFAHAEDEYVEVLEEGGLVGAVLALACLAGLARCAARALRGAPGPGDRVLVLGALAGVVAVLVNGLSDFGLHVAGVAVPFGVVYAHVCRLGADAPPAPAGRRARWAGGCVAAAVAAAVVWQGWREARAEALVAPTGLPLPGGERLARAVNADLDPAVLRNDRAALAAALRVRPDWVDGHLRLALTDVALYRATAAEWLADSVPDRDDRLRMADPLWLLTVLREGGADPATVAAQGPVREHLVPAARGFLEARRRAPGSGVAHAGLAALAWLVEPEGMAGAAADVRRALQTAGPHAAVLLYVAEVAARTGETGLAADCWRRALTVKPEVWSDVAEAAGAALPPAEILARVVPADGGRVALEFADALYPAPAERAARDRFLRAAAERLPSDTTVPPPERLRLEAQAWERLGDRARARARMEAALALRPTRFEWRNELIDWLLAWGDAREAHSQALAGVHLSPGRAEARAALERTADALARGVGGN